jgi:hypothetical protein
MSDGKPPPPAAKGYKNVNPNPYDADALASVHMAGINVKAAGAVIVVVADQSLAVHAFGAWTYHALQGTARCVAVHPFDDESVTVAVAGDAKTIDLLAVSFDAKKKAAVVHAGGASLGPYNKRIVTLCFASASALLFGDKFGEVQKLFYARTYDAKDKAHRVSLPASPSEATFVLQHLSILTAMLVSERHLVTADRDEHLRVCDARSPCVIDGYLWPASAAPSLTATMQWMDGADKLVTGSADGHLRVWDLAGAAEHDGASSLIVEAGLKPAAAAANTSAITGVVPVPGLGVVACVDGVKELQFVARGADAAATAGVVTPMYALPSGATPIAATAFVNASAAACGAVLFRNGELVVVSHLSKTSPVPAVVAVTPALSVAPKAAAPAEGAPPAAVSFPALATLSPLELWSVTVFDPRTTQAKARREAADRIEEEEQAESQRKSARTE